MKEIEIYAIPTKWIKKQKLIFPNFLDTNIEIGENYYRFTTNNENDYKDLSDFLDYYGFCWKEE